LLGFADPLSNNITLPTRLLDFTAKNGSILTVRFSDPLSNNTKLLQRNIKNPSLFGSKLHQHHFPTFSTTP
jgi:hypothetical protein